MSARKGLAIAAAVILAWLEGAWLKGQQQDPMAGHHHPSAPATPEDMKVEQGAVNSMTRGHRHMGPHMKMTAPRPQAPGDVERADALVATLRESLERYKDYRAAMADGFQPFLPNVPQPQYHFTNYWHGFLEAFSFDPARPTSLLYKRTPEGYQLLGAMYTMPKNATEDQLNQRVPLSVASWHLHVNLCMPQKGQRADWTKFGLAGSIATPQACTDAGGNFKPVVFGWMIHVYPFETSPEKIWGQ